MEVDTAKLGLSRDRYGLIEISMQHWQMKILRNLDLEEANGDTINRNWDLRDSVVDIVKLGLSREVVKVLFSLGKDNGDALKLELSCFVVELQ